jgi:hypothetical protein
MAIHTIVALFDDYREAEGAIRELESMGVPSTDMNLVANNAGDRYGNYPQYGLDRPTRTDRTDTASGAGTGAGIGAVLGGAAGLLAGIGALAIPGLGPFIAAGPIMGALAGLGSGGVVGGIVGALVGMGIPEYEAKRYEGRIKQGNILISVHCDNSDWVKKAKLALKQNGVEDISSTGEEGADYAETNKPLRRGATSSV